MANFFRGLFREKKKEKKLDLATVGRRKTLNPEEQEFLRNEAEKLRVPELPSRLSESYRGRTQKGRMKTRKAREKALTAIQAQYRGKKSRKNQKRLKKHEETMRPKLVKLNYDGDEEDYDGWRWSPNFIPPPPSTEPSVIGKIEKEEEYLGGRRTRKRRIKRRRKTKRKGRRKTKKRRKTRRRKR